MIHPNEYNKPQRIIKSNRIILNSILDEIILASNGDIILGTNASIHVNSNNNIHLNTNNGKVYITKQNSSKYQPTVLGDNLVNILGDILNIINSLVIVTPSGTGVVSPDIKARIIQLQQQYLHSISNAYILSNLVYIQ